jgi:hypothetical protein
MQQQLLKPFKLSTSYFRARFAVEISMISISSSMTEPMSSGWYKGLAIGLSWRLLVALLSVSLSDEP